MMPCVDATADAGGFDDDGEGEPMSVSGKLSVCVLGAGSLGCVFGGLLGANGHEVVLVNRNRSLVETLNRNGLVLHTNQGDRSIAVTAAQGCSGLGPFAVVLLLVKSFHTREALEAVGDVIGDDTVVVSLQNGLGHEELIGDIVGMERCILGKTYVGGTMTEPGHIVGGAVGKLTYIGELDGKVSERVARIADQFTEAGLETIASDRIMQIVWDKLLVNAATGALSAITRLPYGHLYDVPEVADCGRAVVAEAMQVAEAAGIPLSITEPDRAWRMAGEGLPFDFKASMLQSIEKGSQTEIDFINGAIVRLGQRLGISTPVNAALVAGVKGIERDIARRAGEKAGM